MPPVSPRTMCLPARSFITGSLVAPAERDFSGTALPLGPGALSAFLIISLYHLPGADLPTDMTKFVFVTGGVVSSLGKGIASASLAAILESRGLKVTLIKLDPYINVDPGTMSPFQHGEVFVTDDGAETDLDLGHYERFVST